MIPERPLRRTRLHAVRRRIETRSLGLSEPLPVNVAEGVDMLLVVGQARSAQDLPALQARLQDYPAAGPIVVGIPTQPGADLAIQDYRWLYRGQPLATSGDRKAFYSTLLRRIYSDSPPLWRADRATRWKALDYLLDFQTPLWLPRTPPPSERSRSPVALLHEALVEPGLLKPVRVSGNTALYELAQGDPARPEGRLFAELLARLYQPQPQPASLAELVSWLGEPPRGLRGLPAWLYLAAAMRCHAGDLRLSTRDASLPLDRQAWQRAWRRPSAWRLEYHPAERHEVAFATSVSRLFAKKSDGPGDQALDLWSRAQRDLREWWEALPPWTRRHSEAHSPNALALARLCEARLDARRLLRGEGIPAVEDQAFLLDRLEAARLELEGHLQGQYDRMTSQIYALFSGQVGNLATGRAWLERGCREWLAGVPPRSAQDQELSPWTQGLRQAILSDAPVERRWFEELPPRLELPPVSRWDTDATVVFLARLARARLDLELWTVLRTLPLDARPEERQRQVAGWIRQTLESVGLSNERAEKILFDLLDQLYSQEP